MCLPHFPSSISSSFYNFILFINYTVLLFLDSYWYLICYDKMCYCKKQFQRDIPLILPNWFTANNNDNWALIFFVQLLCSLLLTNKLLLTANEYWICFWKRRFQYETNSSINQIIVFLSMRSVLDLFKVVIDTSKVKIYFYVSYNLSKLIILRSKSILLSKLKFFFITKQLWIIDHFQEHLLNQLANITQDRLFLRLHIQVKQTLYLQLYF